MLNIIQAPSKNFNERPLLAGRTPSSVIPAKAGIQKLVEISMDSCLRGDDNRGKAPNPIGIDSIIIHYTDMVSAEAALAWLINPASHVSAHYLIAESGQIYQMVGEDKRAWHAGESYWQGRTNLNDCSIGIELANPGHSHGYTPFPEAQIDALITLCLEIKERWNIPGNRILGHSDIAPQRKQDPGHLFPWEKLAQAGLGLWFVGNASLANQIAPSRNLENLSVSLGFLNIRDPGALVQKISWVPASAGMTLVGNMGDPAHNADEEEHVLNDVIRISTEDLQTRLSELGYDVTSSSSALLAFQRHFQPHKVDGIPDRETYRLLQALLKSQQKRI